MPVCNLCGEKNYELLFKGNIGDDIGTRFSQYAYYDDIYRCKNCWLVSQRQRYSTAKIKFYLQKEKYLDETIGRLNLTEKQTQFEVITRIIEKYCSIVDKRLLDVGANTGIFLSTIRNKVGSAQGIEASTEAAEAARDIYGLNVQSGVIEEVNLPDDHFDIVTMFDVVEHLTNPMNDLKILHQKLKLGGKIFITTHDIETWLAKISGRHYPMLMYQHFFHFSPKTLTRMMVSSGFNVIKYERFLKSWSFEYLYNLIDKTWPKTKFGAFLKFLFLPFYRNAYIRKLRIVSPVREFFVIIASKQ